ncbi:MAG: SGNH/GDSL hydrolase family protein [Stackebrandtia sp.]
MTSAIHTPAPSVPVPPQHWTTGWSVPQQRSAEGFEPNWSRAGFGDHTLRQVVRPTHDGTTVRITLSNRYGSRPVTVDGLGIARTIGGARAGRPAPLRFGGSTRVSIPAGQELTSDPAEFRVRALESVAVTMHLPDPTGPATFHAQGYATSYRADGDHHDDTDGEVFGETTHSWYFISDVEVSGGDPSPGTVVAFGDSLTDGFGSGNDADLRWPDQLADRLAATGRRRPVLNAGIGGNLVLNDSPWFGERAITRFARDVVRKPDVASVVILAGLNDFGFSEVDLPSYRPNPDISVDELIAGHRELLAQAHVAGVVAIGGTILPMKGAEYYNETSAAKIREFNEWMRHSGEYDAVADFNAAMADPHDPEALNPAFDSGDHKHPGDKGYGAMAEVVLALL